MTSAATNRSPIFNFFNDSRKSLSKYLAFAVAVGLAACAQVPQQGDSQTIKASGSGTTGTASPTASTPLPAEVLNSPDYKKFLANQEELSKILSFSVKGQVGILNSKERYSSTFNYLSYSPEYYAINLDVPYSTQQVGISRSGTDYIYSRDGKSYYSTDPSLFSKAVFGFEIPIEKLMDLVLARPFVDNYNYAVGSPNVKVADGYVTEQNYEGITVKYSDFRKVGNAYYVPFQINITRGTDKVKIRAYDNDYKIITTGRAKLNF